MDQQSEHQSGGVFWESALGVCMSQNGWVGRDFQKSSAPVGQMYPLWYRTAGTVDALQRFYQQNFHDSWMKV